MNEEVLNMQIRKFLKKVGIQSQREIEQAVRRSIENNSLAEKDQLDASVLLEVPEIGIKSSEINSVIGLKVIKDIIKGEPIDRKNIGNK